MWIRLEYWRQWYSLRLNRISNTNYKKREEEEYPVVYVKGKIQTVKRTICKEIQTYITNLRYWDCSNIKTVYKDNSNIKICESHNNFNYTYADKNEILLRKFC